MWAEDSEDFSKGLLAIEDPSQSYNYSSSQHNNETLLLESSHLPPSTHKSILNLQKYLPSHLEQPFLIGNQPSEISLSQFETVPVNPNQPPQMGELITAISQLSSQIQELQSRTTTRQPTPQQFKNVSSRVSQKDLSSVFTHSTQECKCEHAHIGYSQTTITQLINALNTRNQIAIEEQNQALKKVIVRLEQENLQLRKIFRKIETENNKNKELLKQYQQLSKRQGLKFNDQPETTRIRQTLSGEGKVRDHYSPSLYTGSRANHKSLDPQDIIKQQLQNKIAFEMRQGKNTIAPATPSILGSRQSPVHFQKTEAKNNAIEPRGNAHEVLRATCGLTSRRQNRLNNGYPYRELLEQEIYEIKGDSTALSLRSQEFPLRDRTSLLNLEEKQQKNLVFRNREQFRGTCQR